MTVTLGQPRLGPLEGPNSDPESCNCDQGVLHSPTLPDRRINRVAQGDPSDSTSQEVPGALFVPLWPQEGPSSPATSEEG